MIPTVIENFSWLSSPIFLLSFYHSFAADFKSVFESLDDRSASPADGGRFHKLTTITVIGGTIKPVIAAVTIMSPSSL